jgi:hypothetical protein
VEQVRLLALLARLPEATSGYVNEKQAVFEKAQLEAELENSCLVLAAEREAGIRTCRSAQTTRKDRRSGTYTNPQVDRPM